MKSRKNDYYRQMFEKMNFSLCPTPEGFPREGECWRIDNAQGSGYYWFYDCRRPVQHQDSRLLVPGGHGHRSVSAGGTERDLLHLDFRRGAESGIPEAELQRGQKLSGRLLNPSAP